MKTVIIEDERMTAEDLAEILLQLPCKPVVEASLSSVADALAYFENAEKPDLIFCDIHLGDGSGFEIFKRLELNVPVIFCTAYDQFALEAFRNNGIDYVLKPFTKKTIRDAVDKFVRLSSNLFADKSIEGTSKTTFNHQKSESLLVNWKDKIIPVRITDVAYFFIDYKMTQLKTFDKKEYFIQQTLEELEVICGDKFYRANRQYLINRNSIIEILHLNSRKLELNLSIATKEQILIGKAKSADFLSWLRQH